MSSVWRTLSREKKLELLRRKYQGHEDVGVLAAEVGMNSVTLNRRLQQLRAEIEGHPKKKPEFEFDLPKRADLPTNQELFDILRRGPVSLSELSRRFDRSEATIIDLIDRMEAAGYVIQRSHEWVEVNTAEHPHVDFQPARTLADEAGHEITFAVVSDPHAGSTHAQPSAMNRFIQIAYQEYGVRHIFQPGDLLAGVGLYRGQNHDLVESVRPVDRKDMVRTVDGEVWLAGEYTPALPGLTYYVLGGNHDYSIITNTGIDGVAVYCRQRDDAIYLGYDVCDVPLTDRVSVRLWHPSGGPAYALSYRLQKGLEQVAFDELTRAIEENENPKVCILIAGHFHVENKFHRGPMIGILAGSFEGQTNYLKRKGLYPTIGGAILRLRFTDSGFIQRCEYTFIPFVEVKNDYQNWRTPPSLEAPAPGRLEPIFKLVSATD